MQNFVNTILLINLIYSSQAQIQIPIFPGSDKTAVQLIQEHGYTVERHPIETQDGYIIELHRIPAPRAKNAPNCNERLPILLLHGILCSSAEWVNNSPDQSLAYILADKFYDVWMMNFRGNVYSRRHSKLNPDRDPSFWDFSWQEMSEQDLPAAVQYILSKTSKKKVYLIGHSMGTTIPLAWLSDPQGQNNDWVRAMFLLSPVAQFQDPKGLIPIGAQFQQFFQQLMTAGLREFLPQSSLFQTIANTICNGNLVVLCESVIYMMFGDQPGCLNSTRFPVYISHFPAGTATKVPVHFFQNINGKVFQKFDYGATENRRRYGQDTPPPYRLENCKIPVELFYVVGDFVSSTNDVTLFNQKLPQVFNTHKIEQPKCGHMWLIWGKETGQSMYKNIVNLLEDDYNSWIIEKCKTNTNPFSGFPG